MKKCLLALVVLASVAAVLPARAEVLLLVHGYLGSAHSWDSSGITTILQQRGWQRAGAYLADPVGVRLIPAAGTQASADRPGSGSVMVTLSASPSPRLA